jgi:hypothetical protein
MKFDLLVERLVRENQASRITIGSDEVRDILKTGQVTSKGPYGGETFFAKDVPNPTPGKRLSDMAQKLWHMHGGGPVRGGKKAGYILRADANVMQEPSAQATGGGTYHADKGYVTLPPGSDASNIKTIQRLKQPRPAYSWHEDPILGKERNFDRFQRLYNQLIDAYKSGRINIKPPRITGTGPAGVAALTSFINNELPPEQANALAGGGLGIKGKFEATP